MELSLNEILLIVGSFEARELRTVLMWVCLFALAVIVGGALVSYAVRKLDAVRKRDKVAAVGFVAATLMFMLYAGVSNDWDFRFMVETGVYDAGSWIDEETGEVHAFWDYEQWAAGYKLKWFYTYKYRDEEFGRFRCPTRMCRRVMPSIRCQRLVKIGSRLSLPATPNISRRFMW